MASFDSPPFIVDTHVHLWEADAIENLAWLKPGHRLYRPRALSDYVDTVNGRSGSVENDGKAEDDQAPSGPRVGYIFVECDRKNDGGSSWTHPLEEVAYLRRLVEAESVNASLSSSSQARCLAIVPWAPVHSGPEALARYLDAVKETAGPVAWPRIRGFRYLVQDKPHGTMLTDEFIGSLRLLGRRGFAFDLGIDQHRRGRTQLAEAVSLVEKVHSPDTPDDEKVVLVINHLAKPDITVLNPQADRGFAAWRDTMFTLARTSPDHIFMKVSGLFTEMSPALRDQPPQAFFAAVYPWFAVLLAAFGASRLMFGSDWPVCTLGFTESPNEEDAAESTEAKGADDASAKPLNQGEVGAWDKWRRVVAYTSYMASLSPDDEAMLWGGTAVKAYGLEKK